MRRRLPQAMDWLRPTQLRVGDLMHVTEERASWVRGFAEHDESLIVEISFENAGSTLPDSWVSYLGVWRGKKTVFEFQLGTVWGKPGTDDWDTFIGPLIERLKNYRPIAVAIPDKAFSTVAR